MFQTEPLPEAQVVHIVRQLCSATEYLHLKKIVHRDVKPDNLLVSGESRIHRIVSEFPVGAYHLQ